MNMPHRPLALICSPRSGSTPIAMAIAQCVPMQNFGEIFNHRYGGGFPQGEVSESELAKISPTKNMLNNNDGIMKDRVNFLRNNAKPPYLIKVFPRFCPAFLEPWVESNFEYYFLERRDLFDQMLSFLIAFHTKRWYGTVGCLEPPSIDVRRVDFEAFEMNIFLYKRWRRRALDRPLLYYEDFLEGGWQVVLERFGLPNNGKQDPVLTVKQNLYDKRLAIKNLDQVTDWYRESILQTFAPIV
jgi:hypothetical protein